MQILQNNHHHRHLHEDHPTKVGGQRSAYKICSTFFQNDYDDDDDDDEQ